MAKKKSEQERVKIMIVASGGGSTANVIMKHCCKGLVPNCEIVMLVSTKEGAGCLKKAANNGVKSMVHPANLKTDSKAWNEKLEGIVRTHKIQMVILAGCAREVFPMKGIVIYNTHPAEIERFGGRTMYALKPHRYVLLDIRDRIERERASVDEQFCTTITFHRVDKGIDTGAPLLRVGVPIPKNIVRRLISGSLHIGEASDKLQKHVLKREYAMLPGAMKLAVLNFLDPALD